MDEEQNKQLLDYEHDQSSLEEKIEISELDHELAREAQNRG